MPLAVCLGGFVATLLLWQVLTARERAHVARAVELTGAIAESEITARLESEFLALARIARRWEVRSPTREEWEADARNYIRDYANFQAIEWVDPSFHVRWVVPLRGNEAAQDLNLAFEQRRRTALETARDRRAITATHAIDLVQGDQGFLVYVPIFKGNDFGGFILGVFRMEALLNALLHEVIRSGHGIAVFDDGVEIYRRGNPQHEAAWGDETDVVLPGVTWRVRVWPEPHLLSEIQSPLPELTLGTGLLTTFLLTLTLLLMQTARLRARKLADEITERKQAQEARRESEERLRLALEASRIGTWNWDVQANTLVWDDRSCQIFGRAPDEVLTYETFSACLHPDDVDRVNQAVEATLAGTADYDIDYRVVWKDGTVRNVIAQGAVLRDAAGTPVRMNGAVLDVTEQKQTAKALQENEERLSQAQEAGRIGMFDWNIVENQTQCNDLYFEIFGLDPGNGILAEEDWLARVHPEDRDRAAAEVAQALDAQHPYDTEYRIVWPDGSVHWVHSKAKLFFDAPGHPYRMTGAIIDITTRKQAEEEIRKLNQELEQRVIERTAELAAKYKELEQEIAERKQAEAALRRQAQLLEQVHDSVISTDLNGIVQTWNAGAERIYGYTAAEAIGQHIEFLYFPEDDALLEQQVLSPLHSKGAHEVILCNRRKTGEAIFIDLRLSFAYDETGAPVGLIGCSNDVTERKQAEKALRESEERFRSMIDQSPYQIMIHDPEGTIIDVNTTACKRLGYEHDELVRMTLLDIDPLVDASTRAAIVREIGFGKPVVFESIHQTKSGERFPVEIRSTRMILNGQERIVTSNIDITERKKTEEEIRQLNAELEQRVRERTAQLKAANKELEAFSYSVSHDLRAPLRALASFSKILIEQHADALDPKAEHYLKRIQTNAIKMGVLVDDLLRFSRLSRQKLKTQTVEPTRIVQEVLAELCDMQEGCQVNIDIGALPPCQADPSLLKQVFANLLSNALKYTQAREAARIQVGASVENGQAVYFVADNGVGFDMQYADKLFGVFQRLHRAEDYEGTGVGLALVQRIIHRHGGRVWADAKPDHGATFYFTL